MSCCFSYRNNRVLFVSYFVLFKTKFLVGTVPNLQNIFVQSITKTGNHFKNTCVPHCVRQYCLSLPREVVGGTRAGTANRI